MALREGFILEREAELAALRERLDSLRSGSSALIVVQGRAGVGKSRLLEQARVWASEQGMRVLRARGVPLEQEYTFGMVRQLFDSLLARSSRIERAQWFAGAAADAGELLGIAESHAVALGDFAVLHGLYWLTANLAHEEPLVLLIDDLQWSDQPSLRYLAYLLPRLEDTGIAVIMASRPHNAEASPLVDVITLDPACLLLQPGGLSARSTSALLGVLFDRPVGKGFSAACHNVTGGNPLLLNELVRALAFEGLEPVDHNAAEVGDIGTRAVSRQVSLELSRLAPDVLGVAEAMAVLAPHARLSDADRLAGVTVHQGSAAIDTLMAIDLMQKTSDTDSYEMYEFLHPLIQQAVYEQISTARRNNYHEEAAKLLTDASAAPERIAAHLLRLPPRSLSEAVAVLRSAASEAMGRGAHQSAVAYLRRALSEDLPDDQRLTLLEEASLSALRFDLQQGIRYLEEALALTEDPRVAARLAEPLGLALLYTARPEAAVEVLTHALEELPAQENDARGALQAVLLNIPTVAVGWDYLSQDLPAARKLSKADTTGALMLDSIISAHETYLCDRAALTRARRVLARPDIVLFAAQGASSAVGAYFTLIVGDLEEGIAAHTELIEQARRHGSLTALYQGVGYRALGWLRRGDLDEAETDVREAMRIGQLSKTLVADSMFWAFLSEVETERGHLDEAEAALAAAHVPEDLPPHGLFYPFLHALARLRHAQGRHEEALATALRAGERFAANGGHNPAVVAWRSTAAQCLHALDRTDEALTYATTEVEYARQWGAPFALGKALRVTGTITPGQEGVQILREAAAILETSHAQLEHAYALVALGSALRRTNSRAEARPHLTDGLQIATRLGALPLAEQAKTELRAAGARPRRSGTEGLEALTPSERRVAELAVQGLTNRAIAQQLYVTIKTVEVHLGNCYRKLNISRRGQLHERMVHTDA
ncbi:helix-turn-helix transcriptional regulator [Streptomyces sp. NPDC055109]